MSARTLVAIAAVTVGVLVPTAIASAASAPDAYAAKKTPSLVAQIKALKSQVKKNTSTGKKNTSTGKKNSAKINTVGKSVVSTVAGLNAAIAAANQRTTDLNSKVDGIAGVAADALTKIGAGLTQLGDGLTKLGAAFGDFQYGTVQLYAGTTLLPGDFLATSRLDPTVEQATVTGQFPCLPAAAGGVCEASALHAKVAVRSADPAADDATSTAYCRVTASQITAGTGATAFVTSTPNADFAGAPAYPVTRSPLVPTDPTELAAGAFPLSPASTDVQVDLTGATNSANQAAAGGGFTLNPATTGGGMVSITLSCLSVPKTA